MKKLAFATAVLAFAGPASPGFLWAADLPVGGPAYAPYAPPPPVFDWSGIYIGANGGGGWADTTWGVDAVAFTTHPHGGLAGGQLGFNRQIGPWLFGLPWVFGVEFAGDWADLKESVFVPATTAFPAATWTTKLTDIETITARFGIPVNNWLFYGKAGGAVGFVDLAAVTATGLSFEREHRSLGETFGAGIEYAITRDLILGVEYDFVHLSLGSFSGTASSGRTVTVGANSSFEVQSVVGRLSYRFWAP
jgi:outer membrane immunogenic protein